MLHRIETRLETTKGNKRAASYTKEMGASLQSKIGRRAFTQRNALVIAGVLLATGFAIGLIVIIRSQPQENPGIRQDSDVGAKVESLARASGAAADRSAESLTDLQKLGQTNTIPDVERGISLVERTQSSLVESEAKNKDLVEFVEKNTSELQQRDLGIFEDLIGIYKLDTYTAYHRDLAEFLRSYKEMLLYLRDHLDAIMKDQQAEKARYKVLYSKYSESMERQNNSYKAHLSSIKTYGVQHPKVANTLNDLLKERP